MIFSKDSIANFIYDLIKYEKVCKKDLEFALDVYCFIGITPFILFFDAPILGQISVSVFWNELRGRILCGKSTQYSGHDYTFLSYCLLDRKLF